MSELFQSEAKELNKCRQRSGSSSMCTASLITQLVKTRLVHNISTRHYFDYDDTLLVFSTTINFSALKLLTAGQLRCKKVWQYFIEPMRELEQIVLP